MLPRFSTKLKASRSAGAALLVALTLPSLAAAQGGDVPFTSVVDSSSYLGQTPLRIWQRTRGYGEETAETMLGTHWAAPLQMGLGFIDGNLRIGNSDTDFSVNFGGGFRWRNDDFFTGSPRIFGVSVWYDGEDTRLNNWFNQIGVSFERLGPLVDLRLNANIPLEDSKQSSNVLFTGDTIYTGNNLAQGTLVSSDVTLRVVDFEVAPRLFNLNAWAYAGGYQMDGQGISELGRKGGVRGYIYNDLALDVGVMDDDQFGTNTVVQVIWTPGRTAANISNWQHDIDDRMREQVYRNPYIAVDQVQSTGAIALTNANGDPIRVVHVDSSAAAGGTGTFESPLNDLNTIQANSQVGDIILVHSTSSFTGQHVTLQDAQRLLGEGNSLTHTVFTSELGTITLPETSPGASALARPIFNNADGAAAVVLSGGNTNVSTLAGMEVSNFDIVGGARGIYSPTGVGGVNINRLAISGTTGDGIELTPLIETLANNSKRVRFTPTIDDVTFTNIGGDDIDLNVTNAEPASTAIVETIAISDIGSTNPGNIANRGVGIRLTQNKRAATIQNFNWNGGTTGEGALRIEGAAGVTQGAVTMNGTNAITGGQTGVAGEGYAIRLENGSATHTVSGTTITNTGGASIIASGGTANMNFTGFIEQTANNASILSAINGHDGNLTFTKLAANTSVINATAGDGLQFDNADGVYTFNDNVTMVGTSAAVTAVNDSTAVITINDGTFTDTTGDTLVFDGSSANMTFRGLITQNTNNASVLSVTGGHTGTLTFNERTANAGVITATMGDGLQFNNADGAYTFNDSVKLLAGTSAGINITNGSGGTFAFSDSANDITNPTGIAVNIENSSAVFTYAGNIDADSTSGRPVRIAGNTGGSVTFIATSTIDSTDDGILVENNTGGSVLFAGQVTLNTATQNGVTIQNNTAGSVRFNNLDVTTTTAAAFFATNNGAPATIEVAGTGNTITTTGGVGLSLNTVNVGTAGINFSRVSVANATTSGIVLSNVTGGTVAVGAGGTSNGDGGTISGAGANAINVTNVASASFNRMIINNTAAGFDGIEINHANAAQSTVTVSNTQISEGLIGIDYNRSASATSRLLLHNVDISGTAAEGMTVDISGSADANITIDNGSSFTADNAAALAFNTTGGANKTVRMLIDDSSFANNSAAVAAANFQLGGTVTTNATITGNTFNNAGGARGYVMSNNAAASTVRLNLNGNSASSLAATDYLLNRSAGAGTYGVVDRDNTDANNNGDVEFAPNIGSFQDITAASVQLPQ